MSREGELVECAFLMPLVRDSDRKRHRPSRWRALENALYGEFGGYSGPEPLHRVHRAAHPSLGEYESDVGLRVSDRSRRYIVAMLRERLDDLRQILRQAANTFDQEAVYLSVAGRVEFVRGTEANGYLP